MIKAIVFDMGGVLVDLDMQACIRAFKERAGFSDIEDILDCCHQKGIIASLEGGDFTEEEFIEAALGHCRPGTTAEDVRECFCALLPGLPQYKADLLNELKRDYDLYILSNNNPITVRHSGRLFAAAGAPYESTFKHLFISCDLKLLKPGAAIFRHVIDSIGCRPEEILFIDDSHLNVDAAAALGIRSVFYDPTKDDLRDTVRDALQ